MTSRCLTFFVVTLAFIIVPNRILQAQQNVLQELLDDGSQAEVINTYLYAGPNRGVDLRNRIRESVANRVNDIVNVCQLEEAAAVRLRAAAKADTDRALGKLRRIELQYRGTPVDGSEMCTQAIAEITDFKRELARGEPSQRSLVSRMLPKILTGNQTTLLAEHTERRYQRRRTAACKSIIVDIERSMPMLGDQRQQLLETMLAVEGPEYILPETQAAVGHWFIARVDLDKLWDAFDPGQIRVIRNYQQRWAGLDSTVE